MILRSCLLAPRRLLVLGSLLALSACSSTPMRYHTLIPTQPAEAAANAPSVEFQLQLMPVRIPMQVDQPSLIVRESDGQLSILETALWASPPADEFHDALAFALEHRLGVRDLAGLPANPERPVMSIRTDVRRFDSLPGSHTALDVVWSLELKNSQKQRALTCASQINEPATTEVASLVQAHQRSIGKLAEEIAGAARKLAQDGNTTCL
ncbi:hypothetical protein SAMN05216198_2901 [Halopseudomonas litoralis]|uniref:ABC-type transport auxiliary lipoprotein component domain-containing protein n=1 Tax=Halopseudomonas litoralis TaxID=797277 RepID=A0A1H1VEM1_9GAMM|nr:PqiC family protein [Halopseudomonas litoralis]SDS83173.1 hypothetical protein SAMN05216198_2901 [Halopseudomonas litoralis]